MSVDVADYNSFQVANATRPVIRGRSLVVACGHYLASIAGLRMRALGGNAFDAGVAMALAQSVLEFQSYGFGGEIPILIYDARERRIVVIDGNMRAPAAATIEWFRSRDIALIPGDGFLPAGVCPGPDALITVLDRFGRLNLEQVAQPAIELAADGFPVYESLRWAILEDEARFRAEWPSSAALFLPGGQVPALGDTWRNPDLARTLERLVKAEQGSRTRGRTAALRAARDYFYHGPLAKEIVAFQRDTRVRDASGVRSNGLLTEADFAAFSVRVEDPVSLNYRGYDVHKCGPWSQGPVLLQQLAILEGVDLRAPGAGSADYCHTVIEAIKLAMADRECYYGDPEFTRVPMRGLLAKEYSAVRRELIDPRKASSELRPGDPYKFEGEASQRARQPIEIRPWSGGTTGTRAVDSEGNMFSATPSGGWFHSSPVISGLGFCLGTRGQMFSLDAAHPGSLAPRKRPRTTLSPSLATRNGQPYLVFGSPGGDQQDQWALQFFLNIVEFGMDVQDAIDAPSFQTAHMPSSFYPHEAKPRKVAVEGRVPEPVIERLRARGHDVQVLGEWSLNYTTAISYDAKRGLIEGGASSRGERNYANGW